MPSGHKIKFVGQFKDPQVEIQMNEIVRKMQRVIDSSGNQGSNIDLTDVYSQIAERETIEAVDEKDEQTLESAKNFATDYADLKLSEAKLYTDVEVIANKTYVDQEVSGAKDYTDNVVAETLSDANDFTTTEVGRLETEIENLETRVETLENQVSVMDDELQDLRSIIDDLLENGEQENGEQENGEQD